MLPQFKLNATEPLTTTLVQKNIQTYREAVRYVHRLPYGRNSSKEDLTTVVREQKGTCSSKHAFLKALAEENAIHSVQLRMCIYMMREENTPGVGSILNKYKLPYMLEAHVYLYYDGMRYDFTFPNTQDKKWKEAIIVETDIDADDIISFKNEYHTSFLKDWINRDALPYTPEKIWKIREECIEKLSE